ncbi:MAG TPA: hypothetical protein VL280_08655 [Burkholderiales bacterium]|nr:hypothetical protein [Burkholderiales bacterium]
MNFRRAALAFLLAVTPAAAMTPEGREFVDILKQLEQVHCEKRKLRREIAFAEAEKRTSDAKDLRARFAKLDSEPKTARLEKRLAQLEPRINTSQGVPRDPEDLDVISKQRRDAFYRCE